MAVTYQQRHDGEGWQVEPGGIFKIACCDCGLVHRLVIVADGGVVGMAAERDNRATGQRRRWMRERASRKKNKGKSLKI